MTILILNRGPLATHPYRTWLDGYDGDLVLLASAEKLQFYRERLPENYRYAEAVTGYDADGRLERRVLELARTHAFSHVIACNELDLERAGTIREVLGLDGQSAASASAFRDKVLMKQLVQAAGVDVAPWAEVRTASDVTTYWQRHGGPVVVKPRNGAGAVDVTVLRTAAEVDAYVARVGGRGAEFVAGLMVESFVKGTTYHVDGLVLNGTMVMCWPTRYLDALSTFAEVPSLAAVMLDPDHEVVGRMQDLCRSIVAALPSPQNFSFHAEVFHTPDDRLVMCEIACRTGGAVIKEMVATAFGFDLSEQWVRAQVGLSTITGIFTAPGRIAGSLLVMKRKGRLVKAPAPGFGWITRYEQTVPIGEVLPGPTFASDVMATAIVAGDSSAECESYLAQLRRWSLEEIEFERV
ncbi:ATP-grasp domain-containing protein [Micromonospora sp. KLBMP9576]|uniref:ATP-grasp domain-containing protein n=1 Tax=Micromonospora sp. KLBMP9576 TaxID=3424769 RepID=UPI003D8EC4A5